MKETIICAAVKTKCDQIIRGHRHGDCFYTIIRMELEVKGGFYNQGFITSENRYVNRYEALEIQVKAGIESADKEGYRGKILMSEDLY